MPCLQPTGASNSLKTRRFHRASPPNQGSAPLHQAALSLCAYLRIYRWLLVCSDASMLALAFVLAYWLRFVVGITVSPEVVPAPHQYTRLASALRRAAPL
jgi:hypothetical protein